MGGHGHHHGPPYQIPDYRIYKVENAPELLELKQALAAKGLKDPWIRNEVWRYDPKISGTHKERFRALFFRGFKFGFAAFVATIIIEKIMQPAHSEHGHH